MYGDCYSVGLINYYVPSSKENDDDTCLQCHEHKEISMYALRQQCSCINPLQMAAAAAVQSVQHGTCCNAVCQHLSYTVCCFIPLVSFIKYWSTQ